MVKAAVIEAPGSPLRVEELELAGPGPGEVAVRMRATAMCRSDLHVAQTGEGLRFPAVLGHEGAGVVDCVGEGVGIAVGTPVVLSWTPRCGRCPRCLEGRPQLCQRLSTSPPGGHLSRADTVMGAYMGLGCLAEAVVVPEACAVPVPTGADLERLCLLGCGVTTGFGAAVHAGAVKTGDTVAVFGCGAVGLSAIQGARIAGARRIFAADPIAARRALAAELGATDLIDTVDRIVDCTAGGVDVAIEATGAPEAMERLLDVVHPGGTAVVVGLPGFAATITVSPFHFLMEKTLTGSIYGSADPWRDFAILVDLYAQGRLRLDKLTGGRFDLAGANDALTELADHRSPRPIVTFSAEGS
ncbi:zinc-binding dehydrogenase family protein [Mycobacterium kansasii 732]|uniref:zinc-binding dehydrogenase n=1 Tax=Mycobacterium pseudokansasii TaxID=2341080 RepID=UPI000448B210|nr:zinc-binding dehydrogenase [Mycobacterium pseudokansasii]EUA14573.1 zinc-binding dehydrogenase family protein [Mycobacterium kansasii 732]